MAPLQEIPYNTRATRSVTTRAQQGLPPLKKTFYGARPAAPRKRKANYVEPESDEDEDEYEYEEPSDEEPSDEESSDKESSDKEGELDIFTCDKDEKSDPEPEADEPDPVDATSAALPFANAVRASGQGFRFGKAVRYCDMFLAVAVAIRDASVELYDPRGGFDGLFTKNNTEPLPIHPGWIVKFVNLDPKVVARRALKDVPSVVKSILGDSSLKADNCVAKFRDLPPVSAGAKEFADGVYVDIVDRRWLQESTEHAAGDIETKLYKGGNLGIKDPEASRGVETNPP